MFKYLLLILVFTISALNAQSRQEYLSVGLKPYTLLNARLINPKTQVKPVLVAVIDDAFSLTHKRLSPYYFSNTAEIRNNLKDDDSNGYTDDSQGWDIADGDQKVGMPLESPNAENFLHGSMVAGVIIQAAEQVLGRELTKKNLRILPVKVISDKAPRGNYDQGYEGLKYAVEMGADIICLPWSGGPFDQKYLPYFEKARQKGILILSSAGNFHAETVQKPAGLPGVYSISAVDTSFMKLPSSNYSTEVSLSAVAQNVLAPYGLNDSLYTYLEKTSAAVAMITGCAAVIKALNPQMSPDQIIDLLQNTAKNIEDYNPDYPGKLGAGIPDMGKLTDYLSDNKNRMHAYFDPKRPKGSVWISKKEGTAEWIFSLPGKNSEIVFSLVGDSRKTDRSLLSFTDAQGKSLLKSSLQKFPDDVRLKNSQVHVHISGELPKEPLRLKYYMITTDSTSLYCRETVELTADQGAVEDGSGQNLYAGNCSCKWLITVGSEKNVQLDFSEFSTEEQLDNLMIFKGSSPLQENMMARFSGQKIPPSLVIDGNQVLVWFVTNRNKQDKGFKINYQGTISKPGIVE